MELNNKTKEIWDKAKKCNCGVNQQDLSGDHKLCGICNKIMDYGAHESVQEQINSTGRWNIDHKLAKSIGGTNDISNLHAVHVSCNRNKGNK